MKAFQSGRLLTAVIVTLFSGGLGHKITGGVQLAILVLSGRGGDLIQSDQPRRI